MSLPKLIDDLDAVVSVSGSDSFPVSQGGLTKRGTPNQITSISSSQDASIRGIPFGIGLGAVTTNLVIGEGLAANTTGHDCVAIGHADSGGGTAPLAVNTTGHHNIAIGASSLSKNTTGIGNLAIGDQALRDHISGVENIAVGGGALQKLTTGSNNVAVGGNPGRTITTGGSNVVIGIDSLGTTGADLTGSNNVAVGTTTLKLLEGGASNNTAIGSGALLNTLTGSSNVALGGGAGAYELGSNALYIDNQDRTNTAGDKAKALVYGTFATTAAAQTFKVNGVLSGLGTITNDSASAGQIGEYIESVVGATNFPTSGQFGDLTSITLTAGDWDVTFVMDATINGATVTAVALGISVTTGNSSTGLVVGSNRIGVIPPTAATDSSGCIPVYRASLSGTTIHYAKLLAAYTVATPQASGRLSARRVR